MKPTKRGQPITGERRARLRKTVAEQYREGANIRTIADATGRSYGSVHSLLVEAGVNLRPRGGSLPRPGPLPRHELATQLKQKYEAGATVRELATPEVGSTMRVRTLLSEAGTVMRSTGSDTRHGRKRSARMRNEG